MALLEMDYLDYLVTAPDAENQSFVIKQVKKKEKLLSGVF